MGKAKHNKHILLHWHTADQQKQDAEIHASAHMDCFCREDLDIAEAAPEYFHPRLSAIRTMVLESTAKKNTYKPSIVILLQNSH